MNAARSLTTVPSFIVYAALNVLLPTDESPMITAYLARFAALVNGVSDSDCAGHD